MPTLIRNMGIKKLFPINEILFIKADVAGISLLNVNPARKAPIIGSIPAAWAKRPDMKSITRTKIYCEPLSPSRFLKNHILTLGTPHKIRKENAEIDTIMRIQKINEIEPCVAAEIKASNKSTAVSVMIVPPMVIVTASLLVIPNLLAIG
jgi:hypothetical protein